MLRSVIETSRVVAAHSPGVVTNLRERWPGKPIEHIALGEGRADLNVMQARQDFRSAHAIAPDAIVFGVFGGLTAEKRIAEILLAFRAERAWLPNARLLLVGAADPVLCLEDQAPAL